MELVQTNLLTPMVLAFILGGVAARIGSDLKLPDALYTSLSIYLIFAIGLKGGVALSEASLAEVVGPAIGSLLLGAATPLWCFAILRSLVRLPAIDCAAISAHYGSISIVTFMAGLSYLDVAAVPYEGFMPALAALLEIPGIAVALFLARSDKAASSGMGGLRETLTSKSIVLLAGGLAIGLLSGKQGFAKVSPFFVDPFQGVLALFLLEMGRVAASRLRDLRSVGFALLVFGIAMPIAHGILGVVVGDLSGLSTGGAFALAVLAASASYIAAPAAVRLALPEANPSLYLTPCLAVTFPFNLTVGIPLFYAFASWWYA